MASSTRAKRSEGRPWWPPLMESINQAQTLVRSAAKHVAGTGYAKMQTTLRAVSGLLVRPIAPEAASRQQPDVVRFDTHQRIQHILMFTSFLTLAFTGLPQKFHDWSVSQQLIALLGGLEMTQQIHHVAAYVMLFDCLYHALYLAQSIVLRRRLTALQMIPMPKDLFDAIQMFKYFLGLSDEKPRFGRFSYLEKFDYWAVFWGIAIIGGSGIILLMPVLTSQVLPGGIVPIALAAHSDEAVLAVGWIFIVHFFYVHLAPAVFPFNSSIFTGRVSKHRYQEEHPLEYAKLFAASEEPSPDIAVEVQAETRLAEAVEEAPAARVDNGRENAED